MQTTEIAQLIAEPNLIKANHKTALKAILDQYPFSQTLALLYLKSAALENDINFETELSSHAFRITSRAHLYDLIHTKQEIVEVLEVPEIANNSKVENIENIPEVSIPEIIKQEDEPKILEEKIEIVQETKVEKIIEIASITEAKVESEIPKEEIDEILEIVQETEVERKIEIASITENIEVNAESEIAIEEIAEVLEIVQETEEKIEIVSITENTGAKVELEIAIEEIDEILEIVQETEVEEKIELLSITEIKPELEIPKEESHTALEIVESEEQIDVALRDGLDIDILAHAIQTASETMLEENELNIESKSLKQKEFQKTSIPSKQSFTAWLNQNTTPAQELEKQPKELKTQQLIDSFIENEPKITRLSLLEDVKAQNIEKNEKIKKQFYSPQTAAKESVNEENLLMTETLAKIYALQGNFPLAINAYIQLQLLIPEKNTYFATQIDKLTTKINQ